MLPLGINSLMFYCFFQGGAYWLCGFGRLILFIYEASHEKRVEIISTLLDGYMTYAAINNKCGKTARPLFNLKIVYYFLVFLSRKMYNNNNYFFSFFYWKGRF